MSMMKFKRNFIFEAESVLLEKEKFNTEQTMEYYFSKV